MDTPKKKHERFFLSLSQEANSADELMVMVPIWTSPTTGQRLINPGIKMMMQAHGLAQMTDFLARFQDDRYYCRYVWADDSVEFSVPGNEIWNATHGLLNTFNVGAEERGWRDGPQMYEAAETMAKDMLELYACALGDRTPVPYFDEWTRCAIRELTKTKRSDWSVYQKYFWWNVVFAIAIRLLDLGPNDRNRLTVRDAPLDQSGEEYVRKHALREGVDVENAVEEARRLGMRKYAADRVEPAPEIDADAMERRGTTF